MVILRVLAVVLVVVFAASPASADDDQAKAFFEVGKVALDNNDLDGALLAMYQAHRLSGNHKVLWNIGDILHLRWSARGKTEDLVQAVRNLRAYLEKVPDGDHRNDAKNALSKLVPLLPKETDKSDEATQAPEPPPARTGLMVATPTEDATILLDGTPYRRSPLIVDTAAGSHEIRVRAPGYVESVRTVLVEPGTVIALHVPLSPQPAALSVAGPDGAWVTIDGDRRATLPLDGPISVEPGDHFVGVVLNGYRPYAAWTAFGRGEQRAIEAPLETSAQRYAAWGTMGFGLVGLIVGSSLAAEASTREQEARAIDRRREQEGIQRDEVSAYDDAVASRDNLRVASAITLVAGGASLVTGVFLYLFDEPDLTTQEGDRPPPQSGDVDVSWHGGSAGVTVVF